MKNKIKIFLACLGFLVLTGCGDDRAMTIADLTQNADAENISGAVQTDNGDVTDNSHNVPVNDQNASGTVYVYVCGCVVTPGVYELPAGSRVCDALDAAGGFAEGADTDRINLAAGVSDGEMIFFPKEGEEIPEGPHALININTADVATLCTLPGVGEAKAKAIIRYREEHGAFTDITQIKNVSGIGDNLFNSISELICI